MIDRLILLQWNVSRGVRSVEEGFDLGLFLNALTHWNGSVLYQGT